MGDSVASAVVRQEGATIQTVSKTVHETDGLRVVGARVLSESGKVESSVEFPMITPPSSEPLATSTYSCNQSMAHSVTPETQEHSVSTLERSHMEASKESAVRMESVMEGVSQSSQSIKSCSQSSQSFQSSSQSSQSIQSASQLSQSIQSASQSSQSIQSASQSSQSIQRISQSSQSVQGVSQSQSIEGVVHSQAMEGVSQSQSITEAPAEVPAVSQSQPEPQTVDENANSIQEQQETLVEQPAAEPEPIKEPEPIVEPVKEPEPVVEPEPEPIVELVKEPEPVIEPVKEPEPVVEPEPIKEPEPVKEPVQEPEPIIEPVQEPEPVIESEPVVEAVAEPEPIIATAPEPAAPPDPEPVIKEAPVEPPPVVVEVEEISQENIKTQLQEIISEIEQEVVSEQQEEEEEDGVLHHTWKPKGKYEVPKTTVTYEDVVPISVPEVQFTEVEPKPEPPKPQPQPQPQPQLQQVVAPQNLQGMTNGGFSPGALSPIEIPEGIPLLARILPKVDHGEEGDKKISLERLFTPATDSGDMTPLKKKAYASSSFYRPDHPTIDDQVELAQRISFSLVDENNKMSRGQSMYMKRKKRSMRWIHQGGEGEEDYSGPGSGTEGVEDEVTPRAPTARRPVSMPPLHDTEGKKPAMKLLMNPKGVQDFHAVQEHYQTLMNAAPPSPEVGKIVTEVQSPTGKGAELFAKRKKRMDKFIVDETTVQKAQQQTTTMTQQSFSSSSNFSSSSTGTSSYSTKKQAELERDRQQEQILEQFLRSRESSITMVKTPWEAALETGCAANAFDDKRKRMQLADTVCERADAKAAGAPWLEMPKPVPLAAPQFSAPPPLASGPFNLPDLTNILTKPTKSDSSKSKLEYFEYKPVPPKSKLWQGATHLGGGDPTLPTTACGAKSLTSSSACSPAPAPLTFASTPKPFAITLSPPCSSPAVFSCVSTAVSDTARDNSSINTGSFSRKLSCQASNTLPAFPHTGAATVSIKPLTPVASPKPLTSTVFPKPVSVAASSKPLESVHSTLGAFIPVVPKYKPVRFKILSPRAGSFSPKPGNHVQFTAPTNAEVFPPATASSPPFALDVKSCVPSAVHDPNPVTATATATPGPPPSTLPGPTPSTLPGPTLSTLPGPIPSTLPGPSPYTLPTNTLSSDPDSDKFKSAIPPLFVFPDGTDADSLNDNTTKSHYDPSIEQCVQQLTTANEASHPFEVCLPNDRCRTAHQTQAVDGVAVLDLQGLNPEAPEPSIRPR